MVAITLLMSAVCTLKTSKQGRDQSSHDTDALLPVVAVGLSVWPVLLHQVGQKRSSLPLHDLKQVAWPQDHLMETQGCKPSVVMAWLNHVPAGSVTKQPHLLPVTAAGTAAAFGTARLVHQQWVCW